jgi:RHS repeat-associated protein
LLPVVLAFGLILASSVLAAAPKSPELTIKSVTATPASTLTGGKLAVIAKVADAGPGKAGPSVLAAYLGHGKKHSRSDVKLGTLATAAIKAGHVALVKGGLTVPAATAPGSYTLIACADATAKVKERSESDNCRAGTVITVAKPAAGGTPPAAGGAPADRTSPAPGGGETPREEPPHEEPPHEEPAGPKLPGADKPVPPPPAAPQPTPLPADETVPFAESTNFLFEGPGHVQTGVEDEAIEPARAGVLRGRVLDDSGNPLPSVTVTVVDHPELGQTISRTDGRYELAVNSGGPIMLLFERPTYLTAEREIDPAVRNYENVEDVVLRRFDPAMTVITQNADKVQVAQSSVSDDAEGERRSSLIFMPGTTAVMRMPDGSTKPLKALHVRATEYTVGPRGSESMPADLPPTSAYTFAANYSVDEAVEAGAIGVEFNKAVAVYTDNFLGAPVGTHVPLGAYDTTTGDWVPEGDGRVVKIVAVVGGKAELDVDGDGNADSGAALTALGITDEEREALAGLYGAGKELWRIAISHFSPWDQNFGWGPPPNAKPPSPEPPKPKKPNDPKDPLPPCKEETGSSVDCDTQALREQLPVAGTPYTLNYTSDRAKGGEDPEVEIPLIEASVPEGLKGITLDVEVAGLHTHVDFPPSPNQTYNYKWNGQDVYGRPLVGPVHGVAKISYRYPELYGAPQSNLPKTFGAYPELTFAMSGRLEYSITKTVEFTLYGRPIAPPSGLGGWSLSPQHALDADSGIVELGTGDSMPAPVQYVSHLLVNPLQEATYPDQANFRGATWQPDGSIWFLQDNNNGGQLRMKVRKVAPDGTLSTVATLLEPPGTHFSNSNDSITAAPDGGAWVLAGISGVPNAPIWHVAPNGTITKVTAGDPLTNQPATPNAGNGLPASQVVVAEARNLLNGPDGSLYIGSSERLQHVNADGILETVYEKGKGPGYLTDFGDEDFVFAPDGSLLILHLYFGERVVDRLLPSGKMVRVFGGGSEECCSTGQNASAVRYTFYGPIGVTPTSQLVVNDGTYLDEVTAGGRIRRLAGAPFSSGGDLSDYGAAIGTKISNASASPFDIAPDGRIALPTELSGLRTIQPGIPGYSESGYLVPSSDGREVFRFDPSGRHTETLDALTGVPLEQFAYDAEGDLQSITDRDGRTTTIERNGAGEPTAIVAPTGERTTVSLDPEGNLASVTRPGLPATQLHYGAGGLLTEEVDAAGGVHKFTYDSNGFLTSDTDPDNVKSTISSTPEAKGRTVTVTTPLGRTTIFKNSGNEETGFERTVTEPSGAQTVTKISPSGAINSTLADGVTASSEIGPDPRFGALGRFTKDLRLKEPSGLTFEIARTRQTTLSNHADPFSVTNFTDTFRLGTLPTVTREYDGPSRTLTLTEAGGKKGTEQTDAKGHVVSVQEDAAETPAAITVNSRGQVTKVARGAQVNEYTYDAHDHLATAGDALGHTTHYLYDGAGRLTSTELPAGGKYLYEHDPLDHLTKLTSPSGAAAHLTFTPGGRAKTFVPPGSGSGYENTYDADGLLEKTKLPSGQTVQYGRDAGGRVTSMSYPQATVGIGYVGTDERVASLTRTPSAGSAEGLAMTYDGSLLKSAAWSGPIAGGYSFEYDPNLRLAQVKATAGAASATTTIARNSDGRITEEGPFTLTRSGPQGAITAIAGGPLQTTQTWDALGRLQSRTEKVNGTQAYQMVLTRDAAGRLTQKVETVGATSHTYTYEYDADGRLTGVSRDGTPVEHYAYDADGNRTTREVEGSSRIATYDAAGLITAVGPTAYTTNSDGFVTARGGDTFTWSARGELLSATVGGVTETYNYDGYGRLVGRTANGSTWRYLYGNPDQQLQVTAAVEPDGTLDTLNYTDTGYLYSILRGSTRYYLSTDQVGSPRVVTDASGTAVKKTEYSAYGEVLADSAPSFELPIGYAGGIADPVAGLVHMGLRPYDPASGRFIDRDPLGLGGGSANLFSYAGDEPIQHSDPLGLAAVAGGVCEGVCVGMKLAWTDKGLSACVEFGAGSGNELEYSPEGGLDENKFFGKLTGSAGLGGIVGGELGYETSLNGKCQKTSPIAKICTVGGCVDTEGIKIDANKIFESLAKPAKFGVEAKATLGVCQAVNW